MYDCGRNSFKLKEKNEKKLFETCKRQVKKRDILEKSRLVLGLDVVAELSLALDAGEGARLVLRDGVRAVEDRVAGLDVEQVELDGVARVHVAVREEVLAPQ